jgi:hypothetical protein
MADTTRVELHPLWNSSSSQFWGEKNTAGKSDEAVDTSITSRFGWMQQAIFRNNARSYETQSPAFRRHSTFSWTETPN